MAGAGIKMCIADVVMIVSTLVSMILIKLGSFNVNPKVHSSVLICLLSVKSYTFKDLSVIHCYYQSEDEI